MGVIFLISFIACVTDKGYANDLNKLPPNRNELSSIKNITFSYSDNKYNVKIDLDYIYPITAKAHMQFLHLDLEGDGFSLVMPALMTNPMNSSKHLDLSFENHLSHNFTANLYRSRHLIATKDIQSTNDMNHNSNTSIYCRSEDLTAKTRSCSITNFCLQKNSILAFNKFNYSFKKPFIQYDHYQIQGKMAENQNKQVMVNRLKCNEFTKGKTLIVSMNKFKPFDFDFINIQLAPLVYITNNKSDFHYQQLFILNIQQISSPLFTTGIEIQTKYGENGCFEFADIKQLKPSEQALNYFKQKVLGSITNSDEKKIIVLESSKTKYKNINEIIKEKYGHEPKIINIDSENDLDIIKQIHDSDIVISCALNENAFPLWMKENSSFIELIPKGYECLSNVKKVMKFASNVKYELYSISNDETKQNPIDLECTNFTDISYPNIELTINPNGFI